MGIRRTLFSIVLFQIIVGCNDSNSKESVIYVTNKTLNDSIYLRTDMNLKTTKDSSEVLNGEALTFHRNKYIKDKVAYKYGKIVGHKTSFTKEGDLDKLEIYNDNGELVNFYYFNSKGEIRPEKLNLIVDSIPTEVALGDSLSIDIRIANKIYKNESVIVGTTLNDKYDNYLGDTLKILAQKESGEFNFTIKPDSLGEHTFYLFYMIDSKTNEKDNVFDGLHNIYEVSFEVKE